MKLNFNNFSSHFFIPNFYFYQINSWFQIADVDAIATCYIRFYKFSIYRMNGCFSLLIFKFVLSEINVIGARIWIYGKPGIGEIPAAGW
jgi:hypothetical protein